MTSENLDEKAIFNVARQIDSPEARAAYLRQACEDDSGLRERVQDLLRAYEEQASFLESPPPVAAQHTIDQPVSEPPGAVIGPYKLIEQIGEGGMGTVWMAQQTEPVKRLVALKLIKAGMDSRQVIARFEAERQALALMDHPNIAKVLDGGAVGQAASLPGPGQAGSLPYGGRPYFVMDLVKGVPITKYCDEHHLTPRQRLELFIPVCQAVQHAHQKGIIHRDLKPSNVLVALYDGKPVPKVIDFGVAKAAGQSLTDKTLVTGFGNIVGTLEYMSPEQAEVNQLDIDTRSDIYSLGVLLYELLTGSPPFTREDLEKAGMLEMLRVIREQEPTKPSTKLSTAEGLPTLAANRGTEPAKLTKLVRGELDWIVMKALEKDRNRRYETANGFALDVHRYLVDEPVLAGPPSAWYRFRKFARRNRAQLALAVALVLLLATGGAFGWYLDRQAAQRRTEAVQREAEEESREREERIRRQTRLAQDEEATATLLKRCEEALQADQVAEAALALAAAGRRAADGGAEALAGRLARCRTELALLRELNAIDNQRWTRISDEFGVTIDEPRAIKARWRAALADYGVVAGQTPPTEAAEWVKGSLLRERLLAALDLWNAYTSSFWGVGERLWVRAVLQSADPNPYRDAVRDALLRDDSPAAKALGAQAEALAQPARFAAILGRLTAIPAERRLAILESARRAQPGNLGLLMALGETYPSQPLSRYDRDKAREAVRWYQAAVAAHPEIAAAHTRLGDSLKHAGDEEGAIAELREAVRLAPNDPPARSYLGSLLWGRGMDLGNKVEVDEGLAHLQAAVELDRNDAHIRTSLGLALNEMGERDRAIAVLREAVKIDPDNARSRGCLGLALSKSGARSGNEAEIDEALVHLQAAVQLDPENSWCHSCLGSGWRRKRNVDKAIAEFRLALQLDSQNAPAHADLAWILATGPDRVRDGKQALAHATRACELTQWKEPENIARLAAAYAEMKDFDRACELQKQALSFPSYQKERGENGWLLLRLYARKVRLVDGNLRPRAVQDVGVGLTLRGKLGGKTINVVYEVKLTAGKTYVIDMVSPDQEALDPYLVLQDADGKVVAEDDDGGGEGLNARIVYRAPRDGVYRIHALSYKNAGGGEFTLTVREKKEGALDPKDASDWVKLGASRLKSRDLPGAIDALREALAINDQDATAWVNLGIVLRRSKDEPGAIDAYKKAAAIDEKYARAHNGLAWLLATCADTKLRDPGLAVNHAKKAVELAPKNPDYPNTLGAAYYRAGDWKAAIAVLEKSMGLRKGGDSFDWFFLAMARWQLGEKGKAREWYDRAVEWMEKNQPKNEELRRFRAEAEELLKLNEKK